MCTDSAVTNANVQEGYKEEGSSEHDIAISYSAVNGELVHSSDIERGRQEGSQQVSKRYGLRDVREILAVEVQEVIHGRDEAEPREEEPRPSQHHAHVDHMEPIPWLNCRW